MYISQKYKIVYCHIPKTGGTSISKLFNSISPDDVNLPKSGTGDRKFGYHIPLEYIEVRAKKEAGINISNFTKIISIRHPWGRVWSHWKDYITDNVTKKSIKKIMSFKEFIINRFSIKRNPIEYVYLEHRSLLFYFPSNPKDIIIIKYRNLQNDLLSVVKKYFGTNLLDIPHENNKKNIFKKIMFKRILLKDKYIKNKLEQNRDLKLSYDNVYDEECINIINNYFKEEIDYFNYEF